MRHRLITLLTAISAATFAACSSSTGPKPTMAGTWHVVTGTLSTGNLNPTTFDVVIAASKDTFVATLPSLTWSVGPVTFDSAGSVNVVEDSFVSFSEQIGGSSHVCDYIVIAGILNANRDALHSAVIVVGDTDTTMANTCKPKANGSVTANK